jgi:regulator of protease activity HflC (stomatin/prohibitin superfamily)
LLTGVWLAIRATQDHGGALGGAGVPVALVLIGSIALRGLASVEPGQTLVLQVFGRYIGSVRANGLHWINPLARRRTVSTKIRNQETPIAKVNDADGVPIEIAAVVVWHVEDSARAVYAVEDFVRFVGIQTETAVRHIANSYAYETHDERQLSLRDHAEEITQALCAEMSARAVVAGVNVLAGWSSWH